MTSAVPLLTLDQFYAQYDDEKPYHEFRKGEAIQKSVPTWIHNLLMFVLADFFQKAGYFAAPEVELRISEDWRPIPDVVAHTQIEDPYPTTPVDVVAEVLSPKDEMSRVLEKLAGYEGLGIKAIFLFDPRRRQAWRWSQGRLETLSMLDLPNGVAIPIVAVWERMDEQTTRKEPKEFQD